MNALGYIAGTVVMVVAGNYIGLPASVMLGFFTACGINVFLSHRTMTKLFGSDTEDSHNNPRD